MARTHNTHGTWEKWAPSFPAFFFFLCFLTPPSEVDARHKRRAGSPYVVSSGLFVCSDLFSPSIVVRAHAHTIANHDSLACAHPPTNRFFVSPRQDAAATPCELCKVTKRTGGAMKQADGLGPNGEKLWVHVSCSLWIPEVCCFLLVFFEISFPSCAALFDWFGSVPFRAFVGYRAVLAIESKDLLRVA